MDSLAEVKCRRQPVSGMVEVLVDAETVLYGIG